MSWAFGICLVIWVCEAYIELYCWSRFFLRTYVRTEVFQEVLADLKKGQGGWNKIPNFAKKINFWGSSAPPSSPSKRRRAAAGSAGCSSLSCSEPTTLVLWSVRFSSNSFNVVFPKNHQMQLCFQSFSLHVHIWNSFHNLYLEIFVTHVAQFLYDEDSDQPFKWVAKRPRKSDTSQDVENRISTWFSESSDAQLSEYV